MKILNYVKENIFLFVSSKGTVGSNYYTPLMLLHATTEPPFVVNSEDKIFTINDLTTFKSGEHR